MKLNKIILKGIIFVAIFGVLLMGFSYVFEPKNNTKEAGMRQVSAKGILSEKENTIDVLVIGDSESYSSISPMQIWNEHGITSYVCGTPKQSLHDSYKFLSDCLKTQKPKVVIMETNALFRKYSLEKYFSAKAEDIFPIFEYHNRWKKLKLEDLTTQIHYTGDETLKGFHLSKKVKPAQVKNYKKKTEEVKNISKWNLYYLDCLLKLCQDNDIEFMLLSTPSTKNWNYAKHNRLEQLSQDKNIDFLDMNLVDQIHIDWNKDTRDKGDHLNYAGAQKVTEYLGQYLSQNKQLKNHKQDSYYAKWNDDYLKYQKMIKK